MFRDLKKLRSKILQLGYQNVLFWSFHLDAWRSDVSLVPISKSNKLSVIDSSWPAFTRVVTTVHKSLLKIFTDVLKKLLSCFATLIYSVTVNSVINIKVKWLKALKEQLFKLVRKGYPEVVYTVLFSRFFRGI